MFLKTVIKIRNINQSNHSSGRLFLPIIFLLIISVKFLFAQEGDSLVYHGNYSIKVDSINLSGNETTKDFIILRELTFKVGDTVNHSILEYNRERIYSLDIFTKVELIPAISHGRNIVYIKVEESWYIYPLPFVEIKERDWKKLSFGAYVILKNFRGRNELLEGRVSLGYDPAFSTSYYSPNFLRKEDISLLLDATFLKAKNKSEIAKYYYGSDFDQKFISTGINLGKRIGFYNRFSLAIRYDYVETPLYIPGISASDSRIDRYPSLGLGYSYDTRDLAQFAKEGIFASTSYYLKGFGINGINYQVFTMDFREYRHIAGGLTGKWRFTTRVTSGKRIPYYDYSFIGYNERIRGHFLTMYEGNNYYLSSLQFDYPILKDIDINLNFIPIIPHELLSYRFAIYAEIFGDAGATKLRGRSFGINDIQSGYGTGLAFLVLPYAIIRLELAFDEYHKSQWILDFGSSF